MEVEKELMEKAIRQAMASVALEVDMPCTLEEIIKEEDKVLILKGKQNDRMGRLSYRWY